MNMQIVVNILSTDQCVNHSFHSKCVLRICVYENDLSRMLPSFISTKLLILSYRAEILWNNNHLEKGSPGRNSEWHLPQIGIKTKKVGDPGWVTSETWIQTRHCMKADTLPGWFNIHSITLRLPACSSLWTKQYMINGSAFVCMSVWANALARCSFHLDKNKI